MRRQRRQGGSRMTNENELGVLCAARLVLRFYWPPPDPPSIPPWGLANAHGRQVQSGAEHGTQHNAR